MAARRNSLHKYREKRDFKKTSEPKGIAAKQTGHRYLIQKHAATRLHYDFRLELDGVLKSWAVTRGPSLDPHDKRLAVEVEDHPVAYGSFEGTIPKDQYGGGTVMLWDEGSWEPIGDPHEGLEKGKLEFRLQGKRLHGEWTLVRMRAREKDKGRSNWLLIKHSDEVAHVGDADALLTENTTSVVSDRTMDKIAADADRVWQSKPAKAAPARVKTKRSRSTLPGFIAPQLATLTDAMPQGKNWLHEIKFDGYRTLAYIQDGEVRMLTRTGQDWTPKFRMLADILAECPVDTAILDGEIVVPDAHGVSSFKLLQEALSEGKAQAMQYYVFDLLHLDGKDLKGLPLLERKALLEPLLQTKAFTNHVFYSEHFTGGDASFLQRVCSLQLEGVISKRADAVYSSGRGTSWLKTKCHRRQEFVIGGFTLPTHAQRGVGALLMGYYEGEQLVYSGKVGTGFDQDASMRLRKKLDTMRQKDTPFEHVPADGKRGAHWVKPKLVCEVEFTEWTGDGRLRHPSFQGLREDKPPKTVKRDAPVHAKDVASKASADSVTISHPDRIIYPGTDITKQRLADYYQSMADHILPYIAGRPLSMLRCPEGIGEACFFQRHIARGQSPYLHDTGMKVKGRDESYLMIKDAKGLLTLVQWGVIELHPWGCLADKPELPDRIIFDLDPDPSVPWEKMIAGAREIRTRMQEFGLESFLKTTGGKGLHVTIPIARRYGWPTIKAFAKAIALSMQHDHPDTYLATASKAARKGKIFVDYLRNDLTSTAVAPFSVRARESAPVATPLAWQELKSSLKPAQFTLETVPVRLQKLKTDPWENYANIKQALSPRYLRALNIEPE